MLYPDFVVYKNVGNGPEVVKRFDYEEDAVEHAEKLADTVSFPVWVMREGASGEEMVWRNEGVI